MTKPRLNAFSPIIVLFLATFLFNASVFAQKSRVSGTVYGVNQQPLPYASVRVIAANQKDSTSVVSETDGYFELNTTIKGGELLVISYLGYQRLAIFLDTLSKKDTNIPLGSVTLMPEAGSLQEVTLTAQKIQIKEDTVSYLVDSTMYRKNDNVEALLKNLPGVQVDKDGTVTAQGKQVTKVKVNGKEFFGGDVTTATRELNADMVDRIQIIDDYGDMAAFTGIKDGDPTKTLNIQLRKDKSKGTFGTLNAGVGTEDRYQNNLSVNQFNNDFQLSVLGNLNNTNARMFNFGSGGGGGSMGNMVSGMARSMGIGRGGGGVGAIIGNTGGNDGIAKTQSVGVNYRDAWGRKTSVNGSYSYSNRDNQTISQSTQQTLFSDKTQTFIQQNDNQTQTINHRFQFNVEINIDSFNYLKFTPSINYNSTTSSYNNLFNTDVNGNPVSVGSTLDTSVTQSPGFSGTLLYNHRFRKRGRFMSVNINAGKNTSDVEQENDNRNQSTQGPVGGVSGLRLLQYITQENASENASVRVSYTEPLSKKRSLEFNYAYSTQRQENDLRNYQKDSISSALTYVDPLSNIYENTFTTHRMGINWRTTEKKYNYTIGFSAQPARIQTNSISDTNRFVNKQVNLFPVIRFAYNFSKSRSLNLNYNGNSNQPSNAQLQPVTDRSNPQFLSTGNPNLRPEFTNTISMRYNNFDLITGNVFFGNISVSFTQDKIVNSVRLLRGGIQDIRYLNASGYFTVLGFYNISKPIKNRKYVFNFGGNVIYSNNVSYLRDSLDQNRRNDGRNWVIGQRLSTDIKVKKWLETNLGINYSLNANQNTAQKELNSTNVSWVFSNTTRIFLPKDFIFSFELEKTLNYGLSSNATANPFIIQSSLEKQFLPKKNLSLKLQGFDLLNQNIGVNRSVTATGFTDTRSNRLGRYFLISLIFRLNKFTGQMQGGMGMPGGDMPRGAERMMRML
jgi:hypothetical protein